MRETLLLLLRALTKILNGSDLLPRSYRVTVSLQIEIELRNFTSR